VLKAGESFRGREGEVGNFAPRYTWLYLRIRAQHIAIIWRDGLRHRRFGNEALTKKGSEVQWMRPAPCFVKPPVVIMFAGVASGALVPSEHAGRDGKHGPYDSYHAP